MLPDRVSNPGPLTYESGALMTAQYIKKTQLGGLHNQFVLISISKKKKQAFRQRLCRAWEGTYVNDI